MIQQIDSIPEGAVIFISSPAGITSAVYGGLMSARAKYSKAAGTVIDGRFRDLKEHRDLDYPVSNDPPKNSAEASGHKTKLLTHRKALGP